MLKTVKSRSNQRGVVKRFTTGVVAGVVVLLGTAGLARAQMPSQDFFPIGVFAQPSYLFDTWKGRGLNTFLQWEPETNPTTGIPKTSMAAWSAAAAARGMYYMRWPSANPADDLQEKNLLAWTQMDEPDLENHNPIPSLLIDKYQNLKAISPSKPVLVNFAGNHVTTVGANYKQWVKGGDWLGSDWYPFNADPSRYTIKLIGQSLDKLRADSMGVPKKYFSIIECSNQKLKANSRQPTVAEFRAEIWEALVHGATGIMYFPQQVTGGFKYDATPADLDAEMKIQNARIKALARVLNSTYNPAGRTYATTDSDLEASWRITDNGEYLFVLNASPTAATGATITYNGTALTSLEVMDEARTVTLSGGQFTDNFEAYQLHIYRSPGALPAELPGSVPEPGLASLVVLGGLALLRRSR